MGSSSTPLSAQHCSGYLVGFVLLHEFSNSSPCVCEECRWNSDGKCIRPIDCCKNVNSSSPWAWVALSPFRIFLSYFLQCFIGSLSALWFSLFLGGYFFVYIHCEVVVHFIGLLILFLECSVFMHRKLLIFICWFCIVILDWKCWSDLRVFW